MNLRHLCFAATIAAGRAYLTKQAHDRTVECSNDPTQFPLVWGAWQ